MHDTETCRRIKAIRWNFEDAFYLATQHIEELRGSEMYNDMRQAVIGMHIDVGDAVDSAIARTQYA